MEAGVLERNHGLLGAPDVRMLLSRLVDQFPIHELEMRVFKHTSRFHELKLIASPRLVRQHFLREGSRSAIQQDRHNRFNDTWARR